VDRLLSMEVFVTVVERGSFAAAAGVFELTAAMVGKHIRALEDRLGTSLVTRTTRRHKLTEAGQRYHDHCKRILAEVRVAEANTAEQQATPRGTLRLSAPVSFGAMVVAPLLADFLTAHPEVDVELILGDGVIDLLEGGYDAAVRIGRLPDSSLIVRPLAPYHMMICAAPSYLARHGTPRALADLSQHSCLDFTHWDRHGGWNLGRKRAGAYLPSRARFRSNHGQALRMAALRGAGIIMQPAALLAADVAAGSLVEILRKHLRPPRPMQLVYAKDRHMTPKMRAFLAFMLEHLGRGHERRRAG
jgi:DNA-binding transcriptional LysR family regulator